jgi:hypothetical protein
MKAIELYKFVNNNNIEYHWNDDDVILFVNDYDISEWNKLLGSHILDDSGLSCIMKDGYFCFKMKDICEYFDIELKDIFETE